MGDRLSFLLFLSYPVEMERRCMEIDLCNVMLSMEDDCFLGTLPVTIRVFGSTLCQWEMLARLRCVSELRDFLNGDG